MMTIFIFVVITAALIKVFHLHYHRSKAATVQTYLLVDKGIPETWQALEDFRNGGWELDESSQYTVYGALECLYNRYQCFNSSWWAVDGSSYNEDGINEDVQEASGIQTDRFCTLIYHLNERTRWAPWAFLITFCGHVNVNVNVNCFSCYLAML